MTGGRYAERTTVTPGRTRDELERILGKYGATGFAFGQDGAAAMVAFVIGGRHVRFRVPLPDPADFALTPTRQVRTVAAIRTAHEQAVRARWRALRLIVQAKLEAIDAGVVTFDDEFGMQLVMPDGRTVGEAIGPQLAAALDGTPPALLPGSTS